MDKKTLRALKGSIRKWEKIETGQEGDKGENNCPLCRIFLSAHDICDGCPIFEKTGIDYCGQTPYKNWCKHQETFHKVPRDDTWFIRCPICLSLAHAEIAFLKSLLPKEKP